MSNKMHIAELLNQDKYKERVSKLSEKEKEYLDYMTPLYGVPFAKGCPGMAKSSILRNIATILGFNYIDIRLSQRDEVDLGLYPYPEDTVIVDEDGNEKTIKCLNFIPPKWAIEANLSPTIVHFDEINRSSLTVRNAALQILLEREIGDFKINNQVMMFCSGNLGEEDGTDVEEFDAALNNRLIHIKHDLTADEWIETFAKYNVHPTIVGFIKQNPDYMFRTTKDNDEIVPAYASPRTWTMLSEFIMTKLGDREKQMNGEYDTQKIISACKKHAIKYIGLSAQKYLKYLDNANRVSLNDVLKDFDRVKPLILKSNRDQKSEILGKLKETDLNKIKKRELSNLIEFLKIIDLDEAVGFIIELLDKKETFGYELTGYPIIDIMKGHKQILEKISNTSPIKS